MVQPMTNLKAYSKLSVFAGALLAATSPQALSTVANHQESLGDRAECGSAFPDITSKAVNDLERQEYLSYTVEGEQTLSPRFVSDLYGKCASLVYSLVFGRIGLYNGIVLDATDNYRRLPDASQPMVPEDVSSSDVKYGDYTLAQVEQYEAHLRPGGLEKFFLGVWRGDKDWRVTAFKITPDGTVSRQHPLFTSNKPIRSVGFFPGGHAPSGQVTVIQEIGLERVRAYGYEWSYLELSLE